jgi:hypothetical protein
VRLRGREAALAVAVVVTGSLLVACTSEPAPADVRVAWADASRKNVKVTWSESGTQPNKISVEGVVVASPEATRYVRADQPNEALIPASDFPMNGNFRVSVSIGSTQDGITSKPGLSPMFDTDGPVPPVLTSVQNVHGTAVMVEWRRGAPTEDYTPGDPLDVQSASTSFEPTVVGAGPLKSRPLAGLGRSTRHLIKDVRPPFRFTVRAVNEWGTMYGASVVGDTTTTTASFPRQTVFSMATPVRGRVTRHRLVCRESGCESEPLPGPGLPVVLQARTNASSPWTYAGRTTTGAGGTFYVSTRSPGTRQYRVVALNWDGSPWVAFGSTSSAATTGSRVRVWPRFSKPVVRYRERVTAAVRTLPRSNTTAVLQRWNGRGWIGVKNVAVRNGVGTYTFTALMRGSYGYRFVVRTVRYGGRTVHGYATHSVVLTTR